MNPISWKISIKNSFIALLVNFLTSIIIAFGYAVYLLSKFDFKKVSSTEIGKEIGINIKILFSDNVAIIIFIMIATSLVIFWRAHIVALKLCNHNFANGIIISILPVIFVLTIKASNTGWISYFVISLLYISSGILGSAWQPKLELNKQKK